MATYSVYRFRALPPEGTRSDNGARWRDSTWQPRADIYHSSDTLCIHVETPGLRLEDLQLFHEPGRLILEGRRAQPHRTQHMQCLQMEIEYGAFRRVLRVPPGIDADAIEAKLENGILEIVVPLHVANVLAKKIEVK